MRVTELLGLPVVDVRVARKVGVVRDFLIDPATSRIVGLEVEAPGSQEMRLMPASGVRRVGRDAVMLHNRPVSTAGSVYDAQAQCLDAGTLRDLEILGDDGNILGQVGDAHFNQDTLQVEWYEPKSTGWRRYFGGLGQISPGSVAACSRELMIVRTVRREVEESAPDERQERPTAPRQLHEPVA